MKCKEQTMQQKLIKAGDRVTYIGTLHAHLMNKVLVVKEANLYSGFNCLSFDGDGYLGSQFYTATHFEPANEYPDFKELLIQFCSDGVIDTNKNLYLDIISERSRQLNSNYNKQDILAVLRVLEKYHVKATVAFDSAYDDNISVTLYAEDIMEELSNNAAATLPIEALSELCNTFEVCASITNHGVYYVLGFDRVVYETKEFAVSSVQATKEA